MGLRGYSSIEQGWDFTLKLAQFRVVLQALFQGTWEVAREPRLGELLQALEVLNMAVVARHP